MKRFIRIVAIIGSLALVPALSTADIMKQDQKMNQSRSTDEMGAMDEKGMEEMHQMMPRMMRHMMEMMHEMMGMMKGMMPEGGDQEKLEEMMKHMERMMKGYDETMKSAEGKMAVGTKESGALTKMAGNGGVTAAVTYLNPGEVSPAFEIKLDTHSVDLDQYKWERIVSLRDETGKEYGAPVIESSEGSGHHRSGVLRFKDADISMAKAIELVIKDVAGVKERVFRFER